MNKIDIHEVNDQYKNDYLEVIFKFIDDVLPKDIQKISKENYCAYINQNYRIENHKQYIGIYQREVIGCFEIFYYQHPPILVSDSYIEGEILNMYVEKKQRGNGFGNQFMNYIIIESKKLGIKRLVLNTSPDGEIMYRNNGFTDVSFKEMSLWI